MQDIEHYNPLFTYRRGTLHTVPDSLSRIPGLREEGEPADTERFYTIQQFLGIEENSNEHPPPSAHNRACACSAQYRVTPECTMHEFTPECLNPYK